MGYLIGAGLLLLLTVLAALLLLRKKHPVDITDTVETMQDLLDDYGSRDRD